MDTTRTAPATGQAIPDVRSCTRCDGQQHLVASHEGMGKFRCDRCQMVVGFDLHGEPVEFLIDRGLPGAYTREVFGPELTGAERRL
jgi:hypothetical protein